MKSIKDEIPTDDLYRITVYGNESVRITEHRPVLGDGKPDRTRAPKYEFSIPVVDPTGQVRVVPGPITGATSLPEALKRVDGAVKTRVAEIEAAQRQAVEERSRIVMPGVAATGPRRIIQ
jgi:outer membrane receptor for monomeric catechols